MNDLLPFFIPFGVLAAVLTAQLLLALKARKQEPVKIKSRKRRQ